jgi:hypothetical protein
MANGREWTPISASFFYQNVVAKYSSWIPYLSNRTQDNPDLNSSETMRHVLSRHVPSSCRLQSFDDSFYGALQHVRSSDVVIIEAVVNRTTDREVLHPVVNLHGFDETIDLAYTVSSEDIDDKYDKNWIFFFLWVPMARAVFCSAFWSDPCTTGGASQAKTTRLDRLVAMAPSWMGLHLLHEGDDQPSSKVHLLKQILGVHIIGSDTIERQLRVTGTRTLFAIHHSDWASNTPILPPDDFDPSYLKGKKVLSQWEQYCVHLCSDWSEMTEDERRYGFRELLHSTKNCTCKQGCRCYNRGFYHDKCNPKTCLVLDPAEWGGAIDIHVQMTDHQGKTYSNDSIVSIRTLKEREKLLDKCNSVAKHLMMHKGTSNCRSNSSDLGSMYVLNGETSCVKNCPELRTTLRDVCIEVGEVAKELFPPVVSAIRHTERLYGIGPAYALGGERGISSEVVMSVDLAGPSHMDTRDGSVCLVIWHEQKHDPPTANNWKFMMPNLTVQEGSMTWKGVALKISHGTAIVFDGRDIRHCTAKTEPGEGNNTHGLYCGVVSELILSAMEAVKIPTMTKKRGRGG